MGFEIYNFSNLNGIYYGYVESKGKIDISKHFGAEPNSDFVDNVTVIWVARDPKE
ncbi:hypothetical protein [Intestinibacter sp.]